MIQAITHHPAVQWVQEKSVRYSDLVFNIKIVALNTLYLGGLLFKNIPRLIPNSTLVILSYTGVEWLPYPLHMLYKVSHDALLAGQAKMLFVAAATSLKALVTFLDISLTLGNFAAALTGFVGYAGMQATMYSCMLPVSWASLVLGIVVRLAYIELKKRALKEVNDSSEFQMTPLVRAALNKDDNFKGLGLGDKTETRVLIRNLLEERISYDTTVDLGMNGLGNVLLVVQKFFKPNSIVNATINEAYSIGWLGKLIYEKITQAEDRAKVNALPALKEEGCSLPLIGETQVNYEGSLAVTHAV